MSRTFDVLKHRVDFPSFSTLILIFFSIILLVGILQRTDLAYMANTLVTKLSGDTIQLTQQEKTENESRIAEKKSRISSKFELDIATLLFWGVFGLVLYYCADVFKHTFIDPFAKDHEEEGYIHADKRQLRIKRLFWVIGVFASMMLLLGLVFIFRNLILTYAVLSIYDVSVAHVLYLVASILIATLVTAFLIMSTRITYRAY